MTETSKFMFVVIVMAIFGYFTEAVEDGDCQLVTPIFPYGRGVDSNQLQLARLLLYPQPITHPKRNAELINSLLGLPKNMNNAGK